MVEDAFYDGGVGQPGDEVERLEEDVSGAVAIRRFERVAHIPLWRDCQPVGGHGRAGDIPAQALELTPLVSLGSDPGRPTAMR